MNPCLMPAAIAALIVALNLIFCFPSSVLTGIKVTVGFVGLFGLAIGGMFAGFFLGYIIFIEQLGWLPK